MLYRNKDGIILELCDNGEKFFNGEKVTLTKLEKENNFEVCCKDKNYSFDIELRDNTFEIIEPEIKIPKKSLLRNGNSKNKLVFTSCYNKNFEYGAKGLISSIRKFYNKDEADIILFLDYEDEEHLTWLNANNVEYHFFKDIEKWALKYFECERYLTDDSHFYHKNWKEIQNLPNKDTNNREKYGVGFDKIRHLHPLNVKAYCTGYCILEKNYDKTIHIDCDAFILSNIDMIWDNVENDSVIGWDDPYTGWAKNFKVMYKKEYTGNVNDYSFNAGIIAYKNGDNIKKLITDFMFYIESCYHFCYSGMLDQGIIQSLVAVYHLDKSINFHMHDRTNFNPTWQVSDNLSFIQNEWINLKNNKKQYMWHGAGGAKLWSGDYKSDSVNLAWKYVGGEFVKTKNKIFIDCGCYTGDTVKMFIDNFSDMNKNKFKSKYSEDYEIYAFDGTFYEKEWNELQKKHKNINFINKIVNINDNDIVFYESQYSVANTIIKYDAIKNYNKKLVKSVNIINFLDRFNSNDHIIMKIDIEGSEYIILPELIKTGLIYKINELYVEYHDFLLPEYKIITEELHSFLSCQKNNSFFYKRWIH